MDEPLWPWQRMPARPSLDRLGQGHTARAWILNLVELGHWLSLLSVLVAAWVAFDQADALTDRIGSRWQAFALLISILLPAAGGMGFIVMHAREQWQLTPPAGWNGSGDGHDPVLRRVAYRMVFSGLTVSQLLLPLAVFGARPALLALLAGLGMIAVAGPNRPLLPWRHAGIPVMPVALPLVVAMGASMVLALAAFWHLLAPGLASKGWPTALALLPMVCNGGGGALESTQAETTYNQWWHLVAIVLITCGSLAYALLLAVAF